MRDPRKHLDDRTLTVAAAFAEEREVPRAPPRLVPGRNRIEVRVGDTPYVRLYVRFEGSGYCVPHDRLG